MLVQRRRGHEPIAPPVPPGAPPARPEPLAAIEPADRIEAFSRIRWIFAGLAFAYAATLVGLDRSGAIQLPLPVPLFLFALPLLILAYNGLTRLLSHRGAIAWAAAVGLGGDLLATSIAVHGTGGISSWMWPLYALVTLEAVFLTERTRWAVATAVTGTAAYAGVIAAERTGLWPPIIASVEQQSGMAYVLIKLSWVAMINLVPAIAGLLALWELTRTRTALAAAYERLDRQYVALSQLDRLKSNFLSVVAHELRTPLAILQGYTELLEDDPALSPQSRAYATEATESINRLGDRISRMIAYAALADPDARLHLERLEAAELVEAAAASVEAEVRRAGRVLLVAPVAEGLTLEADRARVVAALVELLRNGCTAAGSAGTVGLEVAANAETVAFRIWDSGAGMPQAICDRLGESFVQADTSDTGHTAGLGLGLAFARLVAQRHGGELVVQPGSPFAVRLELPRNP